MNMTILQRLSAAFATPSRPAPTVEARPPRAGFKPIEMNPLVLKGLL